MYLDYFSIARHPFRITPDPSLFFAGGDNGRGVVLDAMLFAIETGEGILKVVGEVGSGKTMLCRMLEEKLPRSTEVVYLANPRLDADEILYAIAFDLKLPVRRDTSKLLVMQQLQNYLLQQHTAGRKVLVIIEEAQGMSLDTLEEIRLFSNLETSRDKLMQIILFGQPELDRVLAQNNIRQLRERITHSFQLAPLGTKEVAEYIRFRLGAAGCPCPELFDARAEKLIARASEGLTRRINILADKALLAAYAEDVLCFRGDLKPLRNGIVRKRHVMAAIKDSEYLVASSLLPGKFLRWSLAALLMLMIGAGSALAYRESNARFLANITGSNPVIGELFSNASETAVQAYTRVSNAVISIVEASAVEQSSTPETIKIVANLPQETSLFPLSVSLSANDWNFAGEPIGPEVVNSGSGGKGQVNSDRRISQSAAATTKWLSKTRGEGYTIQFISGTESTLSYAEEFLSILEREELLAEAYFCLSASESNSYWTIKHGTYSAVTAAENFLQELPAILQNYKPFVQNLAGVECNSNQRILAQNGGGE